MKKDEVAVIFSCEEN